MSGASLPGADGEARILSFMEACSRALLASAGAPPAADGAAALAAALGTSTPLSFEPRRLDALDTIDAVDPTPLGRQFVDVASLLPWAPTQRADDGGVDLALAPLELVRDLGGLVAGIMYVRPGRQYPLHHHPPHELYLTIAGRAEWRYGGHAGFEVIGPGATIYNHPHDLHSAIAGDTPLVAFYVLWG